jgi:hypothetical protein
MSKPTWKHEKIADLISRCLEVLEEAEHGSNQISHMECPCCAAVEPTHESDCKMPGVIADLRSAKAAAEQMATRWAGKEAK